MQRIEALLKSYQILSPEIIFPFVFTLKLGVLLFSR